MWDSFGVWSAGARALYMGFDGIWGSLLIFSPFLDIYFSRD